MAGRTAPKSDRSRSGSPRTARGTPDVNAPGFAAEARRQSRRVANSPTTAEDQAFVDAVSVWNELPDEDFGLPVSEPTNRK